MTAVPGSGAGVMVLQLRHTNSYGEIVRARKVTGFVLTETEYRPSHKALQHSHELGYFYTVLDGSYTETVGKVTSAREPSALAFRPAGLVHAHSCGHAGGRCFNIYPVCLERLPEGSGTLRDPTDIDSALVPWLVTRIYQEFRRTDAASPLAIEGLALEILAEASRGPASVLERRPPRWLEQARELLHARFSESLSLEEIAGTVCVHPVYLARTFREQYRCTIGEYVRQLRIEFVCRQISTCDTPLSAIALAAGFADQSHLTKTFKRLTGMTPGQFRIAARQR